MNLILNTNLFQVIDEEIFKRRMMLFVRDCEIITHTYDNQTFFSLQSENPLIYQPYTLQKEMLEQLNEEELVSSEDEFYLFLQRHLECGEVCIIQNFDEKNGYDKITLLTNYPTYQKEETTLSSFQNTEEWDILNTWNKENLI